MEWLTAYKTSKWIGKWAENRDIDQFISQSINKRFEAKETFFNKMAIPYPMNQTLELEPNDWEVS